VSQVVGISAVDWLAPLKWSYLCIKCDVKLKSLLGFLKLRASVFALFVET